MSYEIIGNAVICDYDKERTKLELWIADKGYGFYYCPKCKARYKVRDFEFINEPAE